MNNFNMLPGILAASLLIGCGGGGGTTGVDGSNAAPVALFDAAERVAVGTTVSIDASASYDPDGDPITYFWRMELKPNGSHASIQDSGNTSSFIADVIGEYEIHLFVSDGKIDSDLAIIQIASATPIDGIIQQETVLTKVASPYFIVDKVQLAYGASLQLESGVVLMGDGRDLVVYGDLLVQGTKNSPVHLNDVRVVPGNNTSNEPWKIDINHARIEGGSLLHPTGNAASGGFLLRDSVIRNIPYMYLVYPVLETVLERNIFSRAGGIIVAHSDIRIEIRNNVFLEHGVVENYAAYNEPTLVEFNSFLNVGEVSVKLPPGYTDAAIYAVNNYWGTTDPSLIKAMVFDKSVDLGSAGYIDHNPYLLGPHPNTPDPAPFLD